MDIILLSLGAGRRNAGEGAFLVCYKFVIHVTCHSYNMSNMSHESCVILDMLYPFGQKRPQRRPMRKWLRNKYCMFSGSPLHEEIGYIQIVPYNNQDKISFWMSPKCILKNNQSESKAKKQSLTWGNEKVKRSVHHEQAPERVLYTIIYKKEKGKALRLTLATEC